LIRQELKVEVEQLLLMLDRDLFKMERLTQNLNNSFLIGILAFGGRLLPKREVRLFLSFFIKGVLYTIRHFGFRSKVLAMRSTLMEDHQPHLQAVPFSSQVLIKRSFCRFSSASKENNFLLFSKLPHGFTFP